jgi:ligand-binding SRPBCC domain-containing protein
VFDLSRSIDVHVDASADTGERAIAGRTSGLIELGDTVTWSAVHLGVRQRLTIELVALDRPHSFTDRMVSGAFQSMEHRHDFECDGEDTLMSDLFVFQAPLWPLGILAERLVLGTYMRRFLEERNAALKALAEGSDWERYLTPKKPAPRSDRVYG